jgi:hypothetical protein
MLDYYIGIGCPCVLCIPWLVTLSCQVHIPAWLSLCSMHTLTWDSVMPSAYPSLALPVFYSYLDLWLCHAKCICQLGSPRILFIPWLVTLSCQVQMPAWLSQYTKHTLTCDSVMPSAYASLALSGPARYLVCSNVFSRAKICWPENVGLN